MNLALCSLPPLDLAPPSLRAVNSCLVVENGKRCRFGRQEAAAVGGRKVVVACHVMPGPYLEGSFKRPGGGRKLQFVRTLLIDNYDSYTYNIYQELSVVNRVPPVVVRNDEWTWEELKRYLSEEKAFDNIVISPGPGSPTCPSDIGICLQLLLECKDIPILGVCMGHQALGYVHGARIVHASEPVHGRLSEIEHNGCRLFHGIPSGPNSGFNVVRYHSLILDADSLPKELIPIAWTSSTGTHSFLEMRNCELIPNGCESGMEPTVSFHTNAPKPYNVTSWSFSDLGKMPRGGLLMGIMHSSRPHYGLQFHPESIATCHGRQIFHNFREFTEEYWQRLRLKFSCQTDALYDACMQVPGTSQLFGVPINMPDVFDKDIGSFRESSMKCQFLSNGVENNFFSMPQILDLSELGIGLKHVRLKWRKLDQLAAKVGGPKNIFHKLFGTSKAKNTFWLDSSSLEKERARFSFMGGKCGPLWRQLTFRLSDESDSGFKGGGYLFTEDAQGATRRMLLENGFLDFLNKELQSFCYDAKDFEGLPFEFYGGYIGYIGYNLKVECGASNRHMSRTPDACFFFVDNFLVIDHRYDDVYIMSVHEANTTISSWLDDTEERLLSLEPSFERKLEPAKSFPSKAAFVGEKTREQYVSDVQNCLNYIKDGESYELCLTTQLKRSVGEIDSLGLYLLLREKNPAPYAAWMNFSSEHLCICCSSPERFLRLDRNGMLEAKPIKGTVARGATKEEDEQLKLQLQYSEKDQAENLMIVDLLRNDLGRVCEPGSVHVPLLMDVESYATVHTMVSTIRGRKKSRATAVDCIRAAFPGGSMTGAPKLRSMELLDSLESCSRGIYSGSIGFFSFNQTFDLNIVIRTVVIHEGEASIGAGGAIVALSNPEDEYEEMLLKTRAPAKAVIESL